MKINVSIISNKEIDFKSIVPLEYQNLLDKGSVFIESPKSKTDWISITKINQKDSEVDFSNDELKYVQNELGDNFFTILITIKREFANSVFEKIVTNLKNISDTIILITLYTSPLKILHYNDYLILYNKGFWYE